MGVLPTAVSLAASFAVLLLVSWFGPRNASDAIDDDIVAVMNMQDARAYSFSASAARLASTHFLK